MVENYKSVFSVKLYGKIEKTIDSLLFGNF